MALSLVPCSAVCIGATGGPGQEAGNLTRLLDWRQTVVEMIDGH